METRKNNSASVGLPYANNVASILFTIILNTVCILIFCWNGRTTLLSVIISTVSCAFAASFIATPKVAKDIRIMRDAGTLPAIVPEKKLMMRLPRNPVLLALLFTVLIGAIALLLNLLIIRFYEIETFTLLRLLVWQALVACLVSFVICECAVLRYVQPDCAGVDAPVQTGLAKVKNPMSRLSALKNWSGTALTDFGFNMAVGLGFGTTRVMENHSVVINPTTRDGIVAASIVIGIIVTFRMAFPIIKSVSSARDNGQLPPATKRNALLAALPSKPMRMALTLMIPVILLSLVVFWGVLTFFGFEVLSFFQFFVIRSAYTALLSKGVIALAVARYRQPQKAVVGAATA